MGELVLIGQKRWTEQLTKGLKDRGLGLTGIGVDTARDLATTKVARSLRRADLVLRVGFRPGAPTRRGLGLDIALRGLLTRRSRQVMYWIGTDVERVVSERRAGQGVACWRTPERMAMAHLAGSSVLQSELHGVGIDSVLVPFPSFVAVPEWDLPPLPSRFSVLTYIPDARSAYYGGPLISEVARALPQIHFRVMGGRGAWLTQPPNNMEFLGWVSDPRIAYAQSSCVLRIPEHDSIGATAAEGLIFGRPVLYVNDLPYATLVERSVSCLQAELERLYCLHRRGDLTLNHEASMWARDEFDADRRFDRLAQTLLALDARIS